MAFYKFAASCGRLCDGCLRSEALKSDAVSKILKVFEPRLRC